MVNYVPKAPIASRRSASWTQCNSRHSSCHFVHKPFSLSFFSVLQETLSITWVTRRPRPSAMRFTECLELISSKKGRKNAYGSDDCSGDTYFLSRTSWRRAANRLVSDSLNCTETTHRVQQPKDQGVLEYCLRSSALSCGRAELQRSFSGHSYGP